MAQTSKLDALEAVLSDPKPVESILTKVDPIRINPASLGEDVRGPVTRDVLNKIAERSDEDMLLIFRREIRVGGESWMLKTRGLVYLAKQKRVLALPANEQSTDVVEGGAIAEEAAGMLMRQGLKKLAAAAKKEILDHKFEVRRSAY